MDSNEMLKTWTLVKDGSSLSTTEVSPSEESDGISVISESEVFKTNVSDNEEKAVADDVETDNEYQPLTPPMTPEVFTKAEALKERDGEIDKSETTNESAGGGHKTLLIGIAFCVVASILYSHISGMKTEIRVINAKLVQLEHENQLLKAALDKLESSLLQPLESSLSIPVVDEIQPFEVPAEVEQTRYIEPEAERLKQKPRTKTVWLGNEKEDKIEILDKKRNPMLPAYCYFTDENDLFYEYNVEICEAKRRKLEAKNARRDKKIEKEIKADDGPSKIMNEGSYDAYITETLKSLNDEIQDIKRSRAESSEIVEVLVKDEAATESDSIPKKPKDDKPEKPNKRSEKKRFIKQKAVNSGEWAEKRMNGREEARKSHEKQEDVNWYLKRKNEREIYRVEAETAKLEL